MRQCRWSRSFARTDGWTSTVVQEVRLIIVQPCWKQFVVEKALASHQHLPQFMVWCVLGILCSGFGSKHTVLKTHGVQTDHKTAATSFSNPLPASFRLQGAGSSTWISPPFHHLLSHALTHRVCLWHLESTLVKKIRNTLGTPSHAFVF